MICPIMSMQVGLSANEVHNACLGEYVECEKERCAWWSKGKLGITDKEIGRCSIRLIAEKG